MASGQSGLGAAALARAQPPALATRLRPSLPMPAGTVARRAAIVAAAVLVSAFIHIPVRPASLCVLRTLTGVPCPFCGGTTAAVHLGHGDLTSALAASPLAVAMIAVAPLVGIGPRPRWWRSTRLRRTAILAILAAAELWQLTRFGFIHLGAW